MRICQKQAGKNVHRQKIQMTFVPLGNMCKEISFFINFNIYSVSLFYQGSDSCTWKLTKNKVNIAQVLGNEMWLDVETLLTCTPKFFLFFLRLPGGLNQ